MRTTFCCSAHACIAALTGVENTDDNLLLECRAPRELFSRASVGLVSRLDERLHGGPALLLGEHLRRQPGAVSIRSVLSALSDSRVRTEPLHEGLRLAAHGLDSAGYDLFPLLPPVDAASFSIRAADLVRSGQDHLAARLVSSRSPSLLWEAALGPDRAAFWDAASKEWLATPAPPPLPELRRVRIELLMAMGRMDDATALILE